MQAKPAIIFAPSPSCPISNQSPNTFDSIFVIYTHFYLFLPPPVLLPQIISPFSYSWITVIDCGYSSYGLSVLLFPPIVYFQYRCFFFILLLKICLITSHLSRKLPKAICLTHSQSLSALKSLRPNFI